MYLQKFNKGYKKVNFLGNRKVLKNKEKSHSLMKEINGLHKGTFFPFNPSSETVLKKKKTNKV